MIRRTDPVIPPMANPTFAEDSLPPAPPSMAMFTPALGVMLHLLCAIPVMAASTIVVVNTMPLIFVFL